MRAYWENALNLPSALRSVEDVLHDEHPDAAATAFLGVITADRERMQFVSAGHPPPLLCGKGSANFLTSFGSPLGWRFDQQRAQREIELRDAEHLVLYTDGLVEAGRDIDEGMEHLLRVVQTSEPFDSASPAQRIASEALLEEPHDDIAILTVSFKRADLNNSISRR